MKGPGYTCINIYIYIYTHILYIHANIYMNIYIYLYICPKIITSIIGGDVELAPNSIQHRGFNINPFLKDSNATTRTTIHTWCCVWSRPKLDKLEAGQREPLIKAERSGSFAAWIWDERGVHRSTSCWELFKDKLDAT